MTVVTHAPGARKGESASLPLLRFEDLRVLGIVQTWQSLNKWIDERGFPPGRIIGRFRTWTQAEVMAWIEAQPSTKAKRRGCALASSDRGRVMGKLATIPGADLAVKINAAYRAAHVNARAAIEQAAECGRLLIEAKETVGHGGWLRWVEAHTEVSPRHCQRYMERARGWAEKIEGKYDSESHLSLTDALKMLAEPKPKHREMPRATVHDPETGKPRALTDEELKSLGEAEVTTPCGKVLPIGKHAGKTFEELKVGGDEVEDEAGGVFEDQLADITIEAARMPTGARSEPTLWKPSVWPTSATTGAR
jgi:predicted DNA-binding transcriptional regulator AlpA